MVYQVSQHYFEIIFQHVSAPKEVISVTGNFSSPSVTSPAVATNLLRVHKDGNRLFSSGYSDRRI